MSEPPLLPPAQLKVYAMHHGRLPGWKNPPVRVAIDHSRVDAALVDFPVLLALSTTAGMTSYDCSSVFAELGSAANRKRIAVTTADGITQCYVEIKEWDQANLKAYLWVRVPYISPGEDTILYLYADATHADNVAFVGDTAEPAAQQVWANGYEFVGLKPSGGQLLDSSPNANHGTIYGATEVDGPLGRCLSFDGVDDYCIVAHSDSLNIRDVFTIGAFLTHNCTRNQEIIGKANPSAIIYEPFRFSISQYIGCDVQLSSSNTSRTYSVSPTHIPSLPIVCVHTSWDKISGDCVAYIDGVEDYRSSGLLTASLVETTGEVYIGKRSINQNHLDGILAHLAVSSVARSPAWIAATNLSLRDDLVSYAPEDPPLALQAVLDSYAYLAWRRRWRQPDEFEISINRYTTGADELQAGRFVVLKRGSDYRIGIIGAKDLQMDSTGRPSEMWKVIGRCPGAMLDENGRIALAGTDTGTGYDTQTGPAETLMRHYVAANCISPGDADRMVPFLHLETNDLGRGLVTTCNARFQPIATLLEDLCLTSGLGWDLVLDPETWRLVFRVRDGVDRRASQNANPRILFSPGLGNALVTGYHESSQQTISVAIVAGQGEAAGRQVVEVGAGSGFARREAFIDARDLDNADQLIVRGLQRLAEFRDEVSLEMELLPGSTFVYPRDFDLGDLTYAEYPGVATLESRIVEVLEEWTQAGPRISFVLGKEFVDLNKATKWQNRRTDAEVRR